MNEILLAAAIIGTIVLGVTQMFKQIISDYKWLPFINVLIGIVIGLLYAYTIVKADLAVYAWAGVISGLAAGGFYDLQANAKGLNNQRKSTNLIKDGLGEQEPKFEDEEQGGE